MRVNGARCAAMRHCPIVVIVLILAVSLLPEAGIAGYARPVHIVRRTRSICTVSCAARSTMSVPSSQEASRSRVPSVPYCFSWSSSSCSDRSHDQGSSVSSSLFREYASSSASSSRISSDRSVHQRSGGRCENKALLSQLFRPDQMTCGFPGWVFPGLIWGDCPITMCVLKSPPTRFGGPTNF